MNILSIDPAAAKDTACAFFLDDKLAYYELVPDMGGVDDLIYCCEQELDLIVTEDMYLGQNVKTLKELCYAVGKIMYLAEIHMIDCKLIRPVDWKAHHGLCKMRPTMEEYLQNQIIRQTCGEEVQDPDLRAAILIGLCYIEKARLGVA